MMYKPLKRHQQSSVQSILVKLFMDLVIIRIALFLMEFNTITYSMSTLEMVGPCVNCHTIVQMIRMLRLISGFSRKFTWSLICKIQGKRILPLIHLFETLTLAPVLIYQEHHLKCQMLYQRLLASTFPKKECLYLTLLSLMESSKKYRSLTIQCCLTREYTFEDISGFSSVTEDCGQREKQD